MRNIPIPPIDCKNSFDVILKSKRKGTKDRLLGSIRAIKNRYDDYTRLAPQLENIDKSPIDDKYFKDLTGLYENNSSKVKELKSFILLPKIDDFDSCPYCGIGEPKTLDHYLPKEEFPEFSIFPRNLIPVCGVCNSQYKRRKFFRNGERLFVHSYFDILPKLEFISVSIDVGEQISIKYSSVFHENERYFSMLFNNHFTELNLGNRYETKARSEISRKTKSLERIYRRDNSIDDVREELEREAIQMKEKYENNHWKIALYNALSNSNEFCNLGFRKSFKNL